MPFKLLLILALTSTVIPAAEVEQPLIDYSISLHGQTLHSKPQINPFENFTHFGTDFGWMGPGEKRIQAAKGGLRITPKGDWAGAWHSLAGLASESSRLLDPNDLLGLGGPDEFKSDIRAITLEARGKGVIRLELADESRRVLWNSALDLDHPEKQRFELPIDPNEMVGIKFLNWIAEPGAEFQIHRIAFQVGRPAISPEEWAFRLSLGKLRRCHDPESGLTRDRAHLPAGEFDSIASSGMHALAAALGAAEGILNRESTELEIRRTIAAFQALPKASGFLPHFAHQKQIVPGTEYSTVDTSIALHGLLLATRILGMNHCQEEVIALIAAIDFENATDPDGWVRHGFQDDGTTPLAPVWRDWGGETALVLALEAMVHDGRRNSRMSADARPYRGVGFIAEIQSLFYPDFDRNEPDLLSGAKWPEIRHNLLQQQMSYPAQKWPDSPATRNGIFGLSAGEAGLPGEGYTANGTETPAAHWFHPHYMFMGLALSSPQTYSDGIRRLDRAGFLFPLGLPENIHKDLTAHNPMNGSLNACFEVLSAYHGWKKRDFPGNLIDEAARKEPHFRKAALRFFPPHP